MTVYARPGAEGSLMTFQARYGNYIGGEWVAPAQGRYFENATPVTGQTFCTGWVPGCGVVTEIPPTAPAATSRLAGQSGIGRENHKMMLDHYQQTKNLLVSYSDKAQGFF